MAQFDPLQRHQPCLLNTGLVDSLLAWGEVFVFERSVLLERVEVLVNLVDVGHVDFDLDAVSLSVFVAVAIRFILIRLITHLASQSEDCATRLVIDLS